MENNKPDLQNPEITGQVELSENDLEQIVGGSDFKKQGADLAGREIIKSLPVELVTNPVDLAANIHYRGVKQKI